MEQQESISVNIQPDSDKPEKHSKKRQTEDRNKVANYKSRIPKMHNIQDKREAKFHRANDDNTEAQDNIFSTQVFESLEICSKLKSALAEYNYTSMTRIQQIAIPPLLASTKAILKSETGSGKTFTYLIPLLNYLFQVSLKVPIKREQGCYALIICPTVELCIQVEESCKKLLKRMQFIICGCIMGGENVAKEKSRIRKGINIIIATPGRLLYHMQNTQCLTYNFLKYLIFEEADRTLDMGFEKEVKEIVAVLRQKISHEKDADPMSLIRLLLVAATTSAKVQLLSEYIMKDPLCVGFEVEDEEKIVIPSAIKQYYIVVKEQFRLLVLLALMYWKRKSKVMVFFSTCSSVNYHFEIIKGLNYATSIEKEGAIKVFDDAIFKLHGEMDHSTRKVMFSKFNESTCGLMLCTDVAARGLDFKSVKFVVHVDINREIKEYVNRIGRTARLNERGASIMFVMPSEVSYIDMLREKELTLSEMKVGGVFTKYANNIFNDYKLKETAQGMLNRTKFMVKKYLEQYPSVQSLANKAYLSTTRALAGHYVKAEYANYKKVNLTYLARGFGLYRNWTKTKTTRDNYDEKLMQQKKMRMDNAIGSEKKKIAMEFE